MSGNGKLGVVQKVRRFFWLPRDVPRRPVSPRSLGETWLMGVAFGAVVTAFDWFDATFLMAFWAWVEMAGGVLDGARHRWPACGAGLAVGWGVDRLPGAALPDPDTPWGMYTVYALWTLAALATFAAVSRLPLRRAA